MSVPEHIGKATVIFWTTQNETGSGRCCDTIRDEHPHQGSSHGLTRYECFSDTARSLVRPEFFPREFDAGLARGSRARGRGTNVDNDGVACELGHGPACLRHDQR